MASVFDSIPIPKRSRTTFKHGHKNTFAMPLGKLVPVDVFEAYPGDSFRIRPQILSRLMAMNAPLMDQVDLHIDYFKVPVRLIFKDFEEFITGGETGNYQGSIPHFNLAQYAIDGRSSSTSQKADGVAVGSLWDYLRYPTPVKYSADGTYRYLNVTEVQGAEVMASLLPLNAYNLVVNSFYRDQNLERTRIIFDESLDYTKSHALIKMNADLADRCWRKDYFTSALRDPQRGNGVGISLGTSAPVSIPTDGFDFEGSDEGYYNSSLSLNRERVSPSQNDKYMDADGVSGVTFKGTADLSNASAISILALRTAFAIQRLFEGNNIAGGRYKENTAFNFGGVFNGDARLDRPEWFGSASMPVIVSPVDVTAEGDDVVPGDQAGKAKAVGTLGTFRTFCSEHCIIIGIASILPKPQYMQGMPRFIGQRFDRFDWFWPALERIGEQAIKSKEIYCDFSGKGSEGNDDDFGYQMRNGDLKYREDEVHGDMKTSLSFWHTARIFTSRPTLNADFVHAKVPDRIFAVSDDVSNQKCVGMFYFDTRASRMMSKYSTPRLS